MTRILSPTVFLAGSATVCFRTLPLVFALVLLAGGGGQVMGQGAPVITTVSAASYGAVVAPESIAAGFGLSLATGTGAAETIPLPLSLAGTTVRVRDSAGTERGAPLFYVSPNQVNYLIPAGTAPGTATVTAQAGNGTVSTGTVQVARFAPAMFTIDGSGSGVPAAILYRLKPNQQLLEEAIFQRDPVSGRLLARPLDFGPAGDRLFLALYLTGLRGAGVGELGVIAGSRTLPVLFAGAIAGFVGLDQLNVELPRDLTGRLTIAVTAAGFSGFNLGELEIVTPAQVNDMPPRITAISPVQALAGQPLEINGSNFALGRQDNQVQIVDSQGRALNAQIRDAASAVKLGVIVPFGAGSGQLAVRTSRGSNDNASPIPVRTSISGFVENTSRQRLGRVTVRVLGTQVTATSDDQGTFVLPDVPAREAVIEFDGGTAQSSPPYPRVTLKIADVQGARDNQLRAPVTVQQAGVPIIVGSGPAIVATQSLAPGAEAKTIQSGNVIFDLPDNAAVQCPGGAASCDLALAALRNSRTPVNLPVTHFSSTIVQITPIGARFNPGGRLIFPNADNLPAGTQARLFRLDQTAGSATLGAFIAAGTATVSTDGQRVETAANAIAEASLYFVSVARPVATLYGRVLESDGRPVRRAIVQARGQSAFTDGNGGFVLQNVPVISANGTNDPVTLDVSFQRPDGTIDRAQRGGLLINAGGLTLVSPDLALPAPPQQNRPPLLLAPGSLTIAENQTADYGFVAHDADGQALTVNISGAAFASRASLGNEAYNLRLAPGAGAAGSYTILITANDGTETVTRAIAVTVTAAGSQLRANDQSLTTNEDTAKTITLTATNPGAGALTYEIVGAPTRGSLAGAAPNLSYTPAANYNGPDSFSYRAVSGSVVSNVATVFIGVRPVNDTPVLTVPAAQSVNAGQPVSLTISGMDVDAGQTLSITPTGLPTGATFTQTNANTWQLSWTPTFNQAGNYNLSFQLADNGTPTLNVSRDVALTVGVLWAKTSGPEGGQISFLFDTGRALFTGSNGGILRSTDNGRSWVEVNEGLTNLATYSMTASGATLFAGTFGGGVQRSTNNGDTWTPVNEGVTDLGITSLTASGTTIFAGSFNGKVYRSTNQGASWTEVSTGLPATSINSLIISGTTIFAATDNGGVFRNNLTGAAWTAARTGLPQANGAFQRIPALVISNGVLYAGVAGGGVYRTSNSGDAWTSVNAGLPNTNVFALSVNGTTVYAGTFGGGVFRLNANDTWTTLNNGLTDQLVLALNFSGTSFFAGTALNGVYRSTDQGATFAPVNAGLNQQAIGSIYSNGQTLLVATQAGGLFRSTNSGDNWTLSNSGLPGAYLGSITAVGNNLYVGTVGPGVYRSTDQGLSWGPVNNGLTISTIFALTVKDGFLYAGGRGGVARFSEQTNSWTSLSNGLSNYDIVSLTVSGTTLFAGTFVINLDGTRGPGVLRSTDNGATWTPVNNGIPKVDNGYEAVYGLATIGGTLYAGSVGIFRSTDNGNTWVPVNNGLTFTRIRSLVANGATLFAGTSGGGVFRSDNGGANWTSFNAGLKSQIILALGVQGNTVFAGAYGGVFRATPNSQSWLERNSGLPTKFINTIAVSNTTLYAGTLGNGVQRSTDRGLTWQAVNTGLPANLNVQSITANFSGLYAATFDQGVYRSTDGATWTAASAGLPAGQPVNTLRSTGANLFAATDTGVYRSASNGASWTLANTGIGAVRILSLAVSGATIYAGTETGRVFVSTSQGDSWTILSAGLPGLAVLSLGAIVDGTAIFAGMDGGGVYRLTAGAQSWTAVNTGLPPTLNVYTLAASGRLIFAGSIYGVFVSEDKGGTWKQINAGLLDTYVTALALNGDQLLAGTARGGVFSSQVPAASENSLTAQDCSRQSSLRSTEAVIQTEIEFVNESAETRRVFWLDYNGQLNLYGTLNPGESYVQGTFVTHPWVVTDASSQCRGIYLPIGERARAVIR
ncbi:MAG: Ig-like domain-containing protein [Blastocatellia bacterium]